MYFQHFWMQASHILICLSGSPRSCPEREKSEQLHEYMITLHRKFVHNIDSDVFDGRAHETFYRTWNM